VTANEGLLFDEVQYPAPDNDYAAATILRLPLVTFGSLSAPSWDRRNDGYYGIRDGPNWDIFLKDRPIQVTQHSPSRAIRKDGASGTPAEISASKTNNLHRTPTAFTDWPLDGIGLRLVVQTRPSRPAFYAQHT
jgi:hypothetical protein